MNISQFSHTLIFKNMTSEAIGQALTDLNGIERDFNKGTIIYTAGDMIFSMGLIEEGSVTIESNDYWGNRTILNVIGPNDFFGETYAYIGNEPLMVDVVANEACTILFLDLTHISKYPQLVNNLLEISTRKNLHLSNRSFYISPKSIRARVMAYLNGLSVRTRSDDLYIPFDRQQLADYLNVERSALSKELGKMKKDGLINYKKNHFQLLAQKK